MSTTRQILSAAAVIALWSTVALAQVRQLQTGSPMDANPQVGSGGTNRPVPGFVPVNGNDVMSGNVSGLAYFHGRTGTSSPYEFRGNLGSNSLSSFARQSAGAPNYGTYTGVTQPYFLPSSTVSTAQGSLYSAPVGSGFDSGLVPRSSISPLATSAQIRSINGGAEVNGQAIDLAPPPPSLRAGSPGEVLSSPLFVLRTTELPVKPTDLTVPGIPVPEVSPTGGVTPGGNAETQPANPDMVQGAVGGGRDARVVGQNDEIKTAMVSENYLKLADELDKARGNAPGGGGSGAGGGTTNDNNTPSSLTVNTNRTGMDIDPLTGKPRLIATLPSFTGRNGATTQSAMTSRTDVPSPQRLTELSDAELLAGSKVKPVHLAAPGASSGSQVSGYDLVMARAQTNLQAGKFLDAAESYQSALQIKPDDPLALVGRAHAEMGAGIYAAAEYDLKFVFTRKPEMVAVKYDVGSFIPAARQQYLLSDFKKMTAAKATAPMASFLYCYLCYQTGRDPELQAELKAWRARDSHDEWEAVAQRAWTTK